MKYVCVTEEMENHGSVCHYFSLFDIDYFSIYSVFLEDR